MGLGFRRTTHRASENIGEANWSLCEHIGFSVKYVNGSRQPCQLFADIMLSNEDMKWRVNL